MPPKRLNSKAVAANARKAEHEAQKAAEQARRDEERVSAEWSKGANVRGQQRSDEAAQKADEAARKRREKQALLEAEEAGMSSRGSVKLKSNAGGKKKKKDDLSLLENALVSGAEKKVKAQKRAEKEKREAQEHAVREAEAKRTAEAEKTDPLLANTDKMLENAPTRAENRATLEESDATGINAALSRLSVGAGGEDDVKSQRALHLAFEGRMMPKFKEEHPGLRQSQYKEKIFQLWKKSPENPMNQIQE